MSTAPQPGVPGQDEDAGRSGQQLVCGAVPSPVPPSGDLQSPGDSLILLSDVINGRKTD